MMVEDQYEQLEAKMTASFQKTFELLDRRPTVLIDHIACPPPGGRDAQRALSSHDSALSA
jgi:hypothetical protein